MWVDVAILFGVHPWQMLYLDDTKRTWYEQAAMRHRKREAAIRQDFFDAIAHLMGAGESE